MTVYRTAEGRYIAEYCAHNPHPGSLIRLGDLQAPSSSLKADHQAYYLETLLVNCIADIGREAGTVSQVKEVPIKHSAPGHECADAA